MITVIPAKVSKRLAHSPRRFMKQLSKHSLAYAAGYCLCRLLLRQVAKQILDLFGGHRLQNAIGHQ